MKPVHWIGSLLTGMVAVSGVTWVVATHTLRSPAEVAAESEPPDPGPITVAVEERVLASELVVRGTVRFDEPVGISLAGAPAVDGQAVVTRLPEPDDGIDEGDVLLEVSGRPMLALQGPIPAYRDLRPGMRGDDVAQLQHALVRLGHLDGEADGVFGPATRRAVEALYEAVGYEAAGPSPGDEEQLRSAQQRVTGARGQVDAAQRMLKHARQGPTKVQVLEAEQQVTEARAQVEAAEEGSPEHRRARDQLAVAEARLAELHVPPDVSAEQAEFDAAHRELAEATDALADVETATGVWLPASEVAYLPELPQRVDDVPAELGAEATGELVTISSAELTIDTSVPAEDAALVDEGDEVHIGDEELAGVVVEVAARPGTNDVDSDRHHVRVEPTDDASDLVGESLRIRIPVETTDGKVLAVPLAAVSAGADGTSRVEVLDDANPNGATRLVVVEPGLAAEGMIAVTPDDDLTAGDLVVVGADGPDEEHAS